MKQTEVLEQRVEAYVDAVNRALGDVDPEEREAMLDDLRGHASALVEEHPGIDLRDRLGDPASYAYELRDAAGLIVARRARGERIRAAWRGASSSSVGRAATRAWSEFAPAWAFGRGVAVAALVTGWLDMGHRRALVLLVAGGIAGWLLAPRFRRLGGVGRFGAVLRGSVDVAVGVILIVLVVSWATPSGSVRVQPADAEPANFGPGVIVNGSTASNILAFGPDGRPATVALFDQDGTPLTINGGVGATANLTCPAALTAVPVPYLNTAGAVITNAFPARGVCVDAENVVVQDATLETNGVLVQNWASTPMPAKGQTITLDDGGGFVGVVSTPSPSAGQR